MFGSSFSLDPRWQRTYTALPEGRRREVLGDVMTKELWQLASDGFHAAINRICGSTNSIRSEENKASMKKAIFVAPPFDEWMPKVTTPENNGKREGDGKGSKNKEKKRRKTGS